MLTPKTKLSRVVELLVVAASGFLYAVALKYFVLPSKVILTGTEGIATAISYYFDNYWLFICLYIIFQLILIAFAFAKVSRLFAAHTLLVVATVVLCLGKRQLSHVPGGLAIVRGGA